MIGPDEARRIAKDLSEKEMQKSEARVRLKQQRHAAHDEIGSQLILFYLEDLIRESGRVDLHSAIVWSGVRFNEQCAKMTAAALVACGWTSASARHDDRGDWVIDGVS